jgi:pyrroloquinoline-quinone synthase
MTTVLFLDPIVASRSLLKHPFYVKWVRGELSLDDLRSYAKEYFTLVERIPGIVARVRERVSDPRTRSHIDENIREETEHVELWKRFAASLGISESDLHTHEPSPKLLDAVDELEEIADEGADEGVAAIYALELELPMIAKTKKDGLCKFYALESADAHAYFDAHLGEEKHLAVWREIPVDGKRGAAAARRSMAAQNAVLDAVCDARGISMNC